MNRSRLLPLLLLGVIAWTPSTAAAQEPPTLDRVEELARLGRAGEAREMLSAWWIATATGGSRRDMQRAIWLRGQLTPDAAQAELDFRRLVIEFPGGPYSDQALLRLAQAAYAAGDSAGAAESVERLVLEYPSSPVRREAEAWLATAGPVPTPTTPSPAAPARTTPREVEVPAPPKVTDPPPSAGTAAPTGTFAVQLGAFSSLERAEVLLKRVVDAGYEARVVRVPGSELIRVRVGVFDTAAGTGVILSQLRELGFAATVSGDAHREERVR